VAGVALDAKQVRASGRAILAVSFGDAKAVYGFAVGDLDEDGQE
jgi:hypothetical protein